MGLGGEPLQKEVERNQGGCLGYRGGGEKFRLWLGSRFGTRSLGCSIGRSFKLTTAPLMMPALWQLQIGIFGFFVNLGDESSVFNGWRL